MPLGELLGRIYGVIIEPLVFLLFGIAVIIFVWGIVEFIRDSESDEGREKGKRNIIWGVVGMVIMVSVFGIINIIIGTIGADEVPGINQNSINSFRNLENIRVEEN